MILNFKEQIIRDFKISEFNLSEGEILIIEITNDSKFIEIAKELTEIITKMNSKFKYIEHFKQDSFLSRFFPLTVGKYLKNCNENSIFQNKIYEIEWVKESINVNTIAGSKRRLLQLYKTLTETKNIIIDFIGCDSQGSIDIYKILKENQKENGTTILLDYFKEFKNENAKHIKIEYFGTEKFN